MAYSKSKKNDIFISYAHDDDIEGWVNHFAKLLRNMLNKQLRVLENGRTVNVAVWTDASLPPSGSLQNRLEQQILDSALLVVVMSESYLVSEWCREEGEMFIRQLNRRRELKIFIAEKEWTDRNSWPAYLKDDRGDPLLSKVFYEERDVGKFRSIPIKNNDGNFNSEASNAMNDFCEPICNALQHPHSNPPAINNSAVRRVFLALCSQPDGKASQYLDLLRNKLVQLDNLEVMPPLDSTHFQDSLAERLANCDLFVQILDEKKGYYLSDRQTGFVGHQYEDAKQKSIKILQWKVPGGDELVAKDDPYYRFLNQLRPIEETGGTLVKGASLDAFFSEIKNSLQDGPPPTPAESIRVEIRSLHEDREEAIKVGRTIRERSKVWNQGNGGERIRIRPVVLYDGAKAEDLDLLAKLSKGTVIVYARNYRWVDYHEEKVSGETNRVGRIAICDPWPKDAEFLALRQIKMFSNANSADRDREIDEFLEELANALSTTE